MVRLEIAIQTAQQTTSTYSCPTTHRTTPIKLIEPSKTTQIADMVALALNGKLDTLTFPDSQSPQRRGYYSSMPR